MFAAACTSPTRCWSSWLSDQSAHPAAAVGGVSASPAAMRKLDGARPPPTGRPTVSSSVAERNDPSGHRGEPGVQRMPEPHAVQGVLDRPVASGRAVTTPRTAAAGLSRPRRARAGRCRRRAAWRRGCLWGTGSNPLHDVGRRVPRPGCANRTTNPSNRPGPAPDGARTMPSGPGSGGSGGSLSRRSSRVIAWWYQLQLGPATEQVEAGPARAVADRRPARVGDDPELHAPGVDLLGDLVAAACPARGARPASRTTTRSGVRDRSGRRPARRARRRSAPRGGTAGRGTGPPAACCGRRGRRGDL